MKLISPTNREVDIGQTLSPDEYIGMTRREVLDTYLRDRAIAYGANALNALVTDITVPTSTNDKYTITYSNIAENKIESMQVDYIIGADGANSRVAKAMGAGKDTVRTMILPIVCSSYMLLLSSYFSYSST